MRNLFIIMTLLVVITICLNIYSIINHGYDINKISTCIWSFNTWLLTGSICKKNK